MSHPDASARLRLISQVHDALVCTSRHERLRTHKSDLIPIRRGFYLRTSIFQAHHEVHVRKLIVFIAQCLSACRLAPECIALTHEAALVFLDIPVLSLPEQIRFSYRDRRWRLRTRFPEVYFEGVRLSPQRVARFHRESTDYEWQRFGDVRLAPHATLMMDLALQGSQRGAFASSCLLLRQALRRSYVSAEMMQDAARRIVGSVLVMLREKTCRPSKTSAKHFLSALDPRVESLPEGAFLWDLHAWGADRWELQYRVGSYRGDVCFPDQRLIVEIEGDEKLGRDDVSRHRSAAALINRSSDISSRGFRVLAISAADVMFRAGRVLRLLRQGGQGVFSEKRRKRWCRAA